MAGHTMQGSILVFGGNGFIGSETVSMILDQCPNYNVILANRGKSWDWDKEETLKHRISKIVYCDRDKPLMHRGSALADVMENIEDLHCVIDFSGYSSYAVKQALQLVHSKTKLYIYISSDSVYEVCEKTHNDKTTETDEDRPDDENARKALKKADSYGHKKLKGEEAIKSFCCQNQMKFVFLRLADVVGSKDTTERWWQYQLWLKLCDENRLPLYIPEELKLQKISVVYSSDIAAIITSITKMSPETLESISNEAYNLAMEETVTVEELLKISAKILNLKNIEFSYDAIPHIPHIYPSVKNGPINILKATRRLGWSPTPLNKCVEKTAMFYERVTKTAKFQDEKKSAVKELYGDIKDIYPSINKKKLKEILEDIIGLNRK